MAETSDARAQNQAFLAQMERQRLSKPCNRTIDLRGKVPGECQAYTFGDRVHYLDDRGYLLAKQLLDRFNGRYTIGVYETLIKALKKLAENDAERAARENEAEILRRSPQQPQLIAFDQLLHRKEARILFATPVKISIADVLYHAATNDITCSAIRITMKRAYTLASGDQVEVDFTDFAENDPDSPMHHVVYRIIKIEHDEKRSYLVLYRNRDEHPDVSDFLDQWTDDHQTPEYLDLDNELYNIASRFYLRLYTRKLHTPLLWLGKPGDQTAVKAFHLMHAGEQTIAPLLNSQDQVDLQRLPLAEIQQSGQDYIVVITNDNCYTVARTDVDDLHALLSWQQGQTDSHVLLIEACAQHVDRQQFPTEMTNIAGRDADYATQLEQRLTEIRTLVAISDITACCQHFPTATEANADIQQYLIKSGQSSAYDLPHPTALQHHIKRHKERFFIHTHIRLHASGFPPMDLTTSDVSATGLSIKLPENVDIAIGSRVKIDFIRWQKQTSQTPLMGIPFQVRNRRSWAGTIQLGLQRITQASSQKVNNFFDQVLEKNRESLQRDDDDIIHSQETHIFGSLLTKTMTSIPIYFGMSADNKRIIQAIATTETNHAQQLESLWQTLTNHITQLAEIIKNLEVNKVAITFGIYCYFQRGEWVINIEHGFASSAEKSMFISRAVSSERYRFYSCNLMPIQSKTLEQEADLHDQLLKLRNHSVHKVKQIREILNDLFAVGILTDITDIIETAYRRQR